MFDPLATVDEVAGPLPLVQQSLLSQDLEGLPDGDARYAETLRDLPLPRQDIPVGQRALDDELTQMVRQLQIQRQRPVAGYGGRVEWIPVGRYHRHEQALLNGIFDW